MHSLKACEPIVFTDDGIEILFNIEQPEKAEFPISFRVSGRLTSYNEEQPKNASSSIISSGDSRLIMLIIVLWESFLSIEVKVHKKFGKYFTTLK